MRQGEAAPNGAWTGDPLGGVKAPEALTLPNPARFARSAARLEALSAGHPMMEWLRFMGQLAQAQHVVTNALRPFPGPSQTAVDQAVGAQMPPLAADGHRRDPAWRDALAMLLDDVNNRTRPPLARAVIVNMRDWETGALEALADEFLHGAVASAEDWRRALRGDGAASVFYQVGGGSARSLFAAAAATWAMPLLRFDAGFRCGDRIGPDAGNASSIARFVRPRGIMCELRASPAVETRSLSLRGIEGDSGAIKAETCKESPHLREDAVSGARYESGPLRGRPRHAGVGSSRRQCWLGSPRAQPVGARFIGWPPLVRSPLL